MLAKKSRNCVMWEIMLTKIIHKKETEMEIKSKWNEKKNEEIKKYTERWNNQKIKTKK